MGLSELNRVALMSQGLQESSFKTQGVTWEIPGIVRGPLPGRHVWGHVRESCLNPAKGLAVLPPGMSRVVPGFSNWPWQSETTSRQAYGDTHEGRPSRGEKGRIETPGGKTVINPQGETLYKRWLWLRAPALESGRPWVSKWAQPAKGRK